MNWFKKLFSKNNPKNNYRKRVYLDTAASTPLDKEVADLMNTINEQIFGNPSSLHEEGGRAKKILTEARSSLAEVLSCSPEEIVFTSGGTESNNLAIFGLARSYVKKEGKPGVIITSPLEHQSVLGPLKALEKEGWQIKKLGVSKAGEINLKELREILQTNVDVAFVTLAYVNNELGIINPIRDIVKVINRFKKDTGSAYPYFHADYCQAGRFLSLSLKSLAPDLVSFNGSKIYGPKGVGGMVIKNGVKVEPIFLGGGQERGLRSGTENVALVAGLARALGKVQIESEREKNNMILKKRRDYLRELIFADIKDVIEHGKTDAKVPHNLNLTFRGVDSELVVIELDEAGFATSSGSACATNKKSENHVLEALYEKEKPPESSIRFSLGTDVSESDIRKLVGVLTEIIKRHRGEAE